MGLLILVTTCYDDDDDKNDNNNNPSMASTVLLSLPAVKAFQSTPPSSPASIRRRGSRAAASVTTRCRLENSLPQDNQNRQSLSSTTALFTSFFNRNTQNENKKREKNSKKNRKKRKEVDDDDDDEETSNTGLSRRQVLELSVATTGLGISVLGTRQVDPLDYGLWGIFPVGPYRRKKTIFETIVPHQVWTLEQKFGILNVQVPLRMTVLKLSSVAVDGGGDSKDELLVYNPIAVTNEMLQLLQDNILSKEPNCEIKYIVVGSCALEHKVYAGVLAQKFKQATVYLQPGQYSFPVNLPTAPILGFPFGRTQTIPQSKAEAPVSWQQALEWDILGPIISRDGAFGETVILHKATQTLLVTDTCVQITEQVPTIYDYDTAPLLFHARDTVTDIVQDTPETRVKGWKRIVLFGLYFTPSAISIKDVSTALEERRPDINSDFAGVYPWDWVGDEDASWKGLTGDGNNRPLVAPILQTLLLNRSPVEVLDFADRVSQWPITRIIPSHFQNNLALTGKEYKAAFQFLTIQGVPPGYPNPLQADLQTLLDAEESLIVSGAIAPRPPAVGGSATRAEIIQQTQYKCRGGVCAPKASA